MKRFLIFCFFSILIFLFSPSTVSAALVKVNSSGEIIWNVLGDEDALALGVAQRGEIDITQSASGETSELALKRQDGRLFLNEVDVTGFGDDLIEIEERGAVKKVIIRSAGEDLIIEQTGVVAKTSLPIKVSASENELSVTTESGLVFLAVLPQEAAESALRSRFVSRLPNREMTLGQDEKGALGYQISGEKVISIFGVFDYAIPVVVNVSPLTGEVLGVEGPEWFKVFGFLFV